MVRDVLTWSFQSICSPFVKLGIYLQAERESARLEVYYEGVLASDWLERRGSMTRPVWLDQINYVRGEFCNKIKRRCG